MANLMLKKLNVVRSNGTAAVVTGGVKMFLKNFYGSTNAVQKKNVDTTRGATVVTNLNGSMKVDGLLKKQLKYFFDKDVAEGSYISVNVSLWGKRGEILADKLFPAEGDLLFFLADNVTADEFSRKNGQTGLALNVTAYDFDIIRRAKADGEESAANKTPAAQSPAATPNTTPDFEAIDESDDLPF